MARLTATRLKGMPLPLRLYYNHNIYRGFPERKSKSVEINQVGIELIGGSSWRSDLEVVELAARSLDKISGGKSLASILVILSDQWGLERVVRKKAIVRINRVKESMVHLRRKCIK